MGEESIHAPKVEELETKRAVKAAMAQHSKIVAGGDKEAQERCMDEVKGILAKYDCVLVPRAILSPGNAEFIIETRKRPKGAEKLENPYAAELKIQQEMPVVEDEEEEPPL